MKRKFIIFLFFLFLLSTWGCIGFKSVEQKVKEPHLRYKVERGLRSEEDWEYWNEIKKYYESEDLIIIIDDTND